jgi:hypothetical protein
MSGDKGLVDRSGSAFAWGLGKLRSASVAAYAIRFTSASGTLVS